MYTNILLSTDGSDVARKGVEHGITLAKALNAKLTILTVTEALPVDYGGGHDSGWIPTQDEVDSFDAACKARAGKVLDEARAMSEQIGTPAELLHVPNAHPATAIIETAKSRGCDLIVMASHGRRGLRKLFLGSQTSEVPGGRKRAGVGGAEADISVGLTGHRSAVPLSTRTRPLSRQENFMASEKGPNIKKKQKCKNCEGKGLLKKGDKVVKCQRCKGTGVR